MGVEEKTVYQAKHSGQKALKNGCSVMFCSQVTVCSIKETIEGTLVFDGALFPLAGRDILNDKVVLTIKRGHITNIKGGPQAQLYVNWMASWDDENICTAWHIIPLDSTPALPSPLVVSWKMSTFSIQLNFLSAVRGKLWVALFGI